MALPNSQTTIDEQISEYVSGLSDKNKQAVLTLVRTISEAEREADFEGKWAEAVPFEEARAHNMNTVKKYFHEKSSVSK